MWAVPLVAVTAVALAACNPAALTNLPTSGAAATSPTTPVDTPTMTATTTTAPTTTAPTTEPTTATATTATATTATTTANPATASTTPPAASSPGGGSPVGADADDLYWLELVNEARGEAGSSPVTLDPCLQSLASAWANATKDTPDSQVGGWPGKPQPVIENVSRQPAAASDRAAVDIAQADLLGKPQGRAHIVAADARFAGVAMVVSNGRHTGVQYLATTPPAPCPQVAAQPPAGTAPATPAAPAPDQGAPASGAGVNAAIEQQILEMVNAERAAQSTCAPLTLNAKLTTAAAAHAVDMSTSPTYFSHTGRNGSQPAQRIKAAGYNWSAAGENIAYGQKDVQEVMTGWMNSPGHRANILRCSFTELGVGYVGGPNPAPWWVQNFGAP